MDMLVHNDVIIAPLGSGSRGNATFVGTDTSGVLIDCGLSTRQILCRMESIGLSEARIEAVLISHEHSDHVAGARVLDARLEERQGEKVPFYMSAGTASGVSQRRRPRRIEHVVSGQIFMVGDVAVEPFSVPHDTVDPMSFLIDVQGVFVGVLTDLGKSTRLVERQVSRMDMAIVEFNHDVDMLRDGPYPSAVKKRVRGAHGHLSNEQGADILRKAASSRLQHIFLGHLSEANNQPGLAHEAASQALHAADRGHVSVCVAEQHVATKPARHVPSVPLGRVRIGVSGAENSDSRTSARLRKASCDFAIADIWNPDN